MENDNNKQLSIKSALIIQQITMLVIILFIPDYNDYLLLKVAFINNNISILLLFIPAIFIKNKINKYNILSVILNFITFFIVFMYLATITRPLGPSEMNHSVLDYTIVNQTL